ncbi:MAG: MG2 domain-containing protein, partial [Bacteroidetes bacterium]|nr:MG2 domain-containing protein [Bacteroidota bacterium]
MKRLSFFTLIACLWAICISSCTQHPKDISPAPEFAACINAYTGGMITPASSISIELTRAQSSVQINSEVKESLFSFKPALKGKTYWINNYCIQFIPDEGALKPGQLYTADFKLGNIMETDPSLKTFSFSFRVEKQSFTLTLEPCIITEAHPDRATVPGTLRFSHPVSIEKATQMLSSNISNVKPLLEATGTPGLFKILYEGIPRQRAEQNFEVEANGKSAGIDKKETVQVWIPQSGAFYPLSVRPLPPSEKGLEVIFSEPLLPDQNLRGLITPSGGGSSYVFQTEDNRVRIFFERRPDSSVHIDINRGIKSATGMTITDDTSWSVAMESPHPQIELPFPGTILPDAKNLILPFKTVNLTAVDLRIIRIFESNVLYFLQTNTLNTYDELRRSGRLIKQMSIRLDQETDIQPDTWHEFSMDLAPLIRQEPGAIYRIELSMQQAYSLYPGANAPTIRQGNSDDSNRGMITLKGADLSEKEEAFWDQPATYYYDSYGIDWSVYEWSERWDPTKPSYYMNSDNHVSCNVMASNLGVIAKGGAQKMWVTVSDITTVKPVKEAKVTLYNFQLQPIGSATTDADGFALIEPDGKPFVLTAKYQEQTTYLRILDGDENSLSRFDVGGKEVEKGLKGYIYGERGVWRPGDTLFLTFMLEDKQQRLPASHPVTFELYQPTGQFYGKEVATVGKNGFYTFKVSTRPEDPTGLWSAYVKVGGSSFYKPLRIETIKPNRLKIDLAIPNDRIDASRNEVQAQLSAAWLTGATARNLSADVEMHLSATSTPFKGFEQYLFNNPATDFNSDAHELFDGKLDDYGVARFRFKVPQTDHAPGLLRATMLSRVYEPGGDASLSSITLPFSPFETYVGINLNQKKDSWIETDTDHLFDVVTLSPLGALKNTNKPLEYKIYKLSWSWWWEHHDESLSSYINNRSVTPQSSGTVTIQNGKGTIRFRIDYPSWGRYLVYVKDPAGGHATGGIVYVDWPSWRGRAQAADPDGISMLSFSTDKTSCQVGETINVMIPSAVSGKALIALENGSSVLSRSWVDIALDGSTKYSFKVTSEMSPNFYVHISLLQPYDQSVNDLPIRMYGVLPVLVQDNDSHLTPTIDMPDVLRPEQPFTVKVKEQNAKQMSYTLAVVDDGLLDLTNFKTPDPWNEFYAREALGIKTWDMYQDVMGAFGGVYGSLFSIGGDESLSPTGQKANRFKPVVKFLGPFSLKKGETGTHKITLPPYIGSVRVMVVAGAAGAYGNASKTVPVRNPLMLLSTLPRVLSVDEEISLPVNIFAMEEDVKEVLVQLEVSDMLQISGVKSQSLHFNATGDQLCYFNLRTGRTTGTAKVKITATSGKHTTSET